VQDMSQQVRGGAGGALSTARKNTKVEGGEGGRGLSLDSQGEAARACCERQGWIVVDVTEDIVSGSVDPRCRKALGRWLNDPAVMGVPDGPQGRSGRAERDSPFSMSDAYDWTVPTGPDNEPSPQLGSWPAPHGYEPMPKSGWRARRRRPLRRWEIECERATLALEIGFTVGLLVAGWHAEAIGLAAWVALFPVACPRYRLLQLLGLRPPARSERSGRLGP
jgi:hypothetical protein